MSLTAKHKLAIAAVAGVMGIGATSALGFWQMRRAAAKETLQQQIDRASRAPPVTPDARALGQASELVHRHVRFRGRWLPDRAVYLDNRPRAGQAGLYVLMPLRIESPVDADVIVNRGWIPRNAEDRTRISAFRTDAGPVDISGVAIDGEPRLLELTAPASRTLNGIWQNFDPDSYARVSGRMPLPIVVRQDGDADGSAAAPDGLSRDWPDRGVALQARIDRHHGYAFQWFALSATLAALLLFQVFRVVRNVRASVR